MTDSLLVGLLSALWLGILTSISPCPLATNIAAISFLGRRVDSPAQVFWGGFFYTAGRTLTYVALGVVLLMGLLATPQLSQFLQRYMNQILGPILVLAGMFLLELISISLPWGGGLTQRIQEKMQSGVLAGVWGAGLLGVVFALAFCPVSAALFFGSLIPLALQARSGMLMPLLYGIGTALPVVAFAVAIALGARSLGRAFNRLSQFERWARLVTGILFITIGLYFIVVYNFQWIA